MAAPPIGATPLDAYIQHYFPPSEWERARCIAWNECPWDMTNWPNSCETPSGVHSCGQSQSQNSTTYGPFMLMDVCWNPDLNPGSPFTAEQWAQVKDPMVNTWMASVIWSASGWRAWTTCSDCPGTCTVTGTPIPYPRGPFDAPLPPETPAETPSLVPLVAAIVLGGSYAALYKARRR